MMKILSNMIKEKFANIEKIFIKFEETTLGNCKHILRKYEKTYLPDSKLDEITSSFIKCSNSLCNYGRYNIPLTTVIVEMNEINEVNRVIYKKCKGFEKMGKNITRKCMYNLTCFITIEYR